MKIKNPNRINKRKCKRGCGCKLCKPHKGGHTPRFKKKDRALMEDAVEQIESNL